MSATENIANIQLRGFPYEQTVNGEFISCTEALNELAQNEGYRGGLADVVASRGQELALLYEQGFHGLDALVKRRASLTYESSYSLLALVCMASNSVLYEELAPKFSPIPRQFLDSQTLTRHAISLLQAMSTREGIKGLSGEEIAGLIAAALELDTVVRIRSAAEQSIFGIGGMGGDRGITMNGTKTKFFSISTLTAVGLANFGSVHKHHSYPNTSKLSGQSAIEAFNARSDFRTRQHMEDVLAETGVLMSSCHSTRTLHTISHVLKGETINHVIGPGAIPQDKDDQITGLVGVNHNVHPITYAKALREMKARGIQDYGNCAVFCAIDEPIGQIPGGILNEDDYYNSDYRDLIALDEVAPPPFTTMVAFLVNDQVLPVLIDAGDFMDSVDLDRFNFKEIMVPNSAADIIAANADVISGRRSSRTKLLAMSIALGIFTRNFADRDDAINRENNRVNRRYLRECFSIAHDAILTGKMQRSLEAYVRMTNVTRGEYVRN